MASSTLTGKLEADVDIKASPEQFHEMFAHKPHHVHHKIQGCDLHEDGKAKKAKEVVEAVDPDKNLITFRVIEGDLMEEYKSFVAMILVSPKSEDSGSIVHWTLEYEKLHDGIAHPETLRQLV
ncbi:hypothetical protein ES288_A03G181500v1 [Gossypium darwinii]|uniref:Bet v I/Major latex protein domain-containing protein n=1 Tax=Gossypium darwinii TaxID=34276 RepID=A0A5D2H5Y6_GOSDA|nr:hypothetical protein ES288_A03G181500v1 [Gossypium darwinii]